MPLQPVRCCSAAFTGEGSLELRQEMKILYLAMVFLWGLLMALMFLRHCWRTIQVRPAIRRFLEDGSVKVLKISRAGVWRDCGSIRAAFYASLTIKDYHVDCEAPNGTKYYVTVEARFHPVWATLQYIKTLGSD